MSFGTRCTISECPLKLNYSFQNENRHWQHAQHQKQPISSLVQQQLSSKDERILYIIIWSEVRFIQNTESVASQIQYARDIFTVSYRDLLVFVAALFGHFKICDSTAASIAELRNIANKNNAPTTLLFSQYYIECTPLMHFRVSYYFSSAFRVRAPNFHERQSL